MNVGLVVYGDLENTSGGFLYDRQLVERLRARGDDVEVISLPWRTYPRHLLDNVSADLRRRLDRPYDALLQDELCHPSLVRANRLLDPDYPIVSLVHSLRSQERRPALQRWLYRWVERRYLAGVDGVVCNSHATREAVEALGGCPAVVVPPGRGHRAPAVTEAEIAERAEDGPLRVLFVGNVVPRKGVHTLVDGLARLPDGSWRLTVVGSLQANGSYVTRLRRRIEDGGVGEAVTLTGRLSDEELPARLRAHHLLGMPSTYEAFGIAYLEGMGFGLPALATTAGGADEFVTDGENGFLVPPEDPRSIARTLEPLLDDRERLAELGAAARETYESHRTWDETATEVRGFLRRFVGERVDAVG